ncbi:DUF3667 domain-containing protein [Winogradskyella aquimaris]|uniref:DUF3667 domain-containing protein n=1 Tax=Winogradskyella aquimaris TaxID=864074 RepID=A0ABU5EPA2_9FLAO|nr:DUF3667 domain-containing protein [Winogradskyella aquimaris]MDY2586696.1 DUF3667 domain-containing protein [Winogradskyella aquimaris]
MSTIKDTCQNCEEQFDKGFRFCPYCGQKTNDELTIGVLFYNTISNYFSFDARFLKSFVPLMFKPGYLAKQFIKGKRLMYLHPAQMYLFISVVFFFLSSFTIAEWEKEANELNKKIASTPAVLNEDNQSKIDLDSIKKAKILEDIKKSGPKLGLKEADIKMADSIIQADTNNANVSWDFDKNKIDSLIKTGAEDAIIYKEMGMSDDAGYFERGVFKGMLNIAKGSGAGNMLRRAFDAVPITMFILLPLFALILKIFYFRRGRYAYHLVFTFYFFSFLFTLFAILLAVDRFLFEIPWWISFVLVLSTFFYFYLGLLKFYERHWFTTLIKSGFITFIFSILVVLTSGFLFFFGLMNA